MPIVGANDQVVFSRILHNVGQVVFILTGHPHPLLGQQFGQGRLGILGMITQADNPFSNVVVAAVVAVDETVGSSGS